MMHSPISNRDAGSKSARRCRTERQQLQDKGSNEKSGVRRKHTAEPVYVANRESTIRLRGGGRASMVQREGEFLKLIITSSKLVPTFSDLHEEC